MGTRRAFAWAAFAIAAALVAACGDEDFANDPRPPVPVELTGVVQDDKITVSPAKLGAGPILITISNQTGQPRIISIEGASISQEEGPVNPGDTATIRQTLTPGTYEVRAGTERAARRQVAPATLEIGEERENSNGDLLLP